MQNELLCFKFCVKKKVCHRQNLDIDTSLAIIQKKNKRKKNKHVILN